MLGLLLENNDTNTNPRLLWVERVGLQLAALDLIQDLAMPTVRRWLSSDGPSIDNAGRRPNERCVGPIQRPQETPMLETCLQRTEPAVGSLQRHPPN